LCNNNFNLLISSNGQINFKNLLVGIYNINISYTFNNQSVKFNYYVTIKPTIKYNNLLLTTVNPIGGTFNIDNNNFFINENTGEITTSNNIIGNYNLNITYTFNNISTTYNNNIEIKPLVKYSDYNIIINY
jgi:hypothetical protein